MYATYWGMFQIGGANWKLCGTESYEDFVERMCRSERDQLELFAALIEKCGYTKYLRNHDWTSFARRYNGPATGATTTTHAWQRHMPAIQASRLRCPKFNLLHPHTTTY